jgi:hypothetical protein
MNYDEVYGDEVTTNIKGVAAGLFKCGATVSTYLLL